MSWFDNLHLSFLYIVVALLLVAFPLYLLFGGLRTFAIRPLERCFRDVKLHGSVQPGDVSIVYHTYRGLVLWVTQDEHRIIGPPEHVQRVLRRLLWFHLTCGRLSYGAVFVPFVAVGNYWAQQRSIRRQALTADRQMRKWKERNQKRKNRM